MLRTLFVLLAVATIALAAPTEDLDMTEVAEVDAGMERSSNTSSTLSLPGVGDVSFNMSSLMNFLISGGAVVLAFVGLASILTIVLPLFGFKLCYLTGTCPADPATSYLAGSALASGMAQAYDAYHTYQQPSAAYNTQTASSTSPTYQKRSIEYFGPILKALNAAYEKYESVIPKPTPVKME